MADWSYAPGELPAILTGGLALLFAGPAAPSTARAVLAGTGAVAGWETALDIVLRGGVAAAPDLFAGQLTDDTLTGVVRGGVRVTVAHRDGRTTELSGAGLRTWREFQLSEVASFTADAGAPAAGALTTAHPGPLAVSRLSCTVQPAVAADPGLTLEFSDALFEQAPELAPRLATALQEEPAAGRYDELFGATIHFGVEAAAVRPAEEDAEEPGPREEPAGAISGNVCVVLPDGRSVPLQGTVLIGRSPRADRIEGDQIPTLVAIDDRDVSRTHVRVRAEGRQVLLEDLGSTNGTVFTAVGAAPRRIRQGEVVLVTDGAVADLGTGSRITFAGVP